MTSCLPHTSSEGAEEPAFSLHEGSLRGFRRGARLIFLKGGTSPPSPPSMYSNINPKKKKTPSDSKPYELSLCPSLQACHRRAEVQNHHRWRKSMSPQSRWCRQKIGTKGPWGWPGARCEFPPCLGYALVMRTWPAARPRCAWALICVAVLREDCDSVQIQLGTRGPEAVVPFPLPRPPRPSLGNRVPVWAGFSRAASSLLP